MTNIGICPVCKKEVPEMIIVKMPSKINKDRHPNSDIYISTYQYLCPHCKAILGVSMFEDDDDD